MATFVGGIYYGGDTDDTITGTTGNDTLHGGAGNDVIKGLEGDDQLVGGLGGDTIDGGAGNDIITASTSGINSDHDGGVDRLTGGAGADIFRFDLGFPDIGGNLDQIDHITDFSAAEGDRLQLYSVMLNERQAWIGPVSDANFTLKLGQALGTTPTGYIGLFTWNGPDATYLVADVDGDHVLSARDFVLAFDNRPTLTVADIIQVGELHQFGGAGADVWTGIAGDDIYHGREGADQINGGAGADTLYGDAGDDVIDGGAGNDTILGGDGVDTIHGGDGDDLIYAGYNLNPFGDSGEGANRLYGDAGDDRLIGAAGVDILEGGAGNDLLSGGQDIGQNSAPGDILRGGDGDDFLSASGVATLDGGAGADRLALGGGALTVSGGAGADAFLLTGYQRSSTPWTKIGYATITDFNAADGDKIVLAGRTYYPAVFRGNVDGSFSLAEGAVFSTRDYGPGFSQFWTWASGGDTYLFIDDDGDGKLSARDVVLKLNGAPTLSQADFAIDSQLENFAFAKLGGTDGADVFLGTDGTDTYYGLNGDDEIHGGGGYDDYLYGGNGNDKIWGEDGSDWIYGGPGDDSIWGGAGYDTIRGGAGNDVIYGGDGDDYINASGDLLGDSDASDAANVVYGEAGNDNISGYGSKDRLYGGDGNDSVAGNGQLFGDAGNDNVFAFDYAVIHGGDGDDFIGGGRVGSVLYGDAGKDVFQGGDGDTILYVELGDGGASGGYGDDVFYLADVRAGESVFLTNVRGDAGADTFIIQQALSAPLVVQGGEGVDVLDLRLAPGAVTVNLSSTHQQDTGFGRFTLQSIESVLGGDRGAILTGDSVANVLVGGAGVDTLTGGGGNDTLTGGGANDTLDGGEGLDIAVYAGASSDYSWSRLADGSWTIKDVRAVSADGQDVLKSVEILRFLDKTVSLTQAASQAILRGGGDVKAADLEGRIAAGTLSLDGAIKAIVDAADATTSVASMSYQFFTGKVPTALGFDYLVSPTGGDAGNINGPAYAYFNTVNRYINFAMNLGRNGEAKDSFAAEYGSLTLFEATRKAYGVIFGATPNDAKVTQLLEGRVDFLASFSGDAREGIGTKAAMVGFLLAAAATENVGVFARANDAWLTDLADGSAPYAVNIIDPANGYYKADFIYGG